MPTHALDSYQDEEKNSWRDTSQNDEVEFSVLEDNKQSRNIYSENNNYYQNQGYHKKTLSPKLVFGVLLFLALGTLIYGFVSLSSNIYGLNQRSVESGNSQPEASNLISDLLELQNKDTDKDGLSDYDELYLYKTSPYLPDTDSDGYLDKQEIDGGYDPLCPKGQDCRGTSVVPGQESTSTAEQEVALPPETGTGTEPLPQEVVDELNKLTPDQVRELLRASGQFTEEQINQIDDETLMQVYREVLGSQ